MEDPGILAIAVAAGFREMLTVLVQRNVFSVEDAGGVFSAMHDALRHPGSEHLLAPMQNELQRLVASVSQP